MAHMRKPFPPIRRARFDVPDGFELWLRRMTAKQLEQRFVDAAEARRELQRLQGTAPSRAIPISWTDAEPANRSSHLEGVGLGLFGVRHVPFVGRETERDTIWKAFGAAATGRSSMAIIHGDSGFGKSRLAEWTYLLTREKGLAFAVRASFGDDEPYTRGVQGLLHRLLRTAGLNGEKLEERVHAFLARHRAGDVDARILTGMLDPAGAHTMVPASQAFESVWRLLERLASDRPIVLWCDDLHEDPEALKFALHGLDSGARVLVLGTLNDEARLPDAIEDYGALLASARERTDVFSVQVGKMSDTELAELVRLQVQLPESIMQRVLERADGSPLFALQLLDDWVGRGVLRAESGAFVLSGSVPALPSSVRELWQSRVDGLVDEMAQVKVLASDRIRVASNPATVRRLLHIAAILGRSVRREEWDAVATKVGVRPIPFLAGELVAARLVEPTDEGFVFVHAMLRKLLLEEAREDDTWKATHAACASTLSALYDADHPMLSLRLARHFSEAGAHVPALVAAQHATYEARYAFDVDGILQGTAVWAECLDAASAGPKDLRRVDVLTLRAYAYLLSSSLEHRDVARELFDEADRIAATTDRVSTHARAASRRAVAAMYLGGVTDAVSRLERVLERPGLERRHDLLAEAKVSLSRACMVAGNDTRALELAKEAVEIAAHPALVMQSHAALGRAALHCGDLKLAGQHNGKAIEIARDKNYLVAEARAHETAAFIADAQGDYVRAEQGHVEALRLFELVATRTSYPDKQREYVARAQIAQGRWSDAKAVLDDVAKGLEAGRAGFYTHLEDAMLACYAGLRDWNAFDATVDAAFEFDFEPYNLHHRAFAIAAAQCAEAGESARRERVVEGLTRIVGPTKALSLLDQWS
jgi:tetratricopeptide (TPR) repeat protein